MVFFHSFLYVYQRVDGTNKSDWLVMENPNPKWMMMTMMTGVPPMT